MPFTLPLAQNSPSAPADAYSTGPTRPSEYGGTAPASAESSDHGFDFKDGVHFKSKDGQFSLRINNLLQADYRDFTHTAGDSHTPTSLHDNFNIAREWLYFRGNVTEYVDYQTVIASGAGVSVDGPSTVNLLDAFVDFNPFGAEAKEKFQIRVGRYKTPFLYQFYVISPQDFITPELSMFSTNYLQNRQLGVMGHGKILTSGLSTPLACSMGYRMVLKFRLAIENGFSFSATLHSRGTKEACFKTSCWSGPMPWEGNSAARSQTRWPPRFPPPGRRSMT